MAKTDLARIEADLAEKAKNLQQQIGAPETKRITVDQKSGELIAPGGLSLGDEQRIIVIDFCSANKYFDQPYDSAKPVPPACMAIGDVIVEMRPEDGVPAPQSDLCKNCWANQWESDAKGKGKACKNTRELAIVLADELEDPDFEPELYVISCSPTSLKSFDAAALKVAQLFNGPPIKAILTMKVAATENYYNLRFGMPDANPYLERVYHLLEDSPTILGALPDFSKYTEPKHFPPQDIRNQQARKPARR